MVPCPEENFIVEKGRHTCSWGGGGGSNYSKSNKKANYTYELCWWIPWCLFLLFPPCHNPESQQRPGSGSFPFGWKWQKMHAAKTSPPAGRMIASVLNNTHAPIHAHIHTDTHINTHTHQMHRYTHYNKCTHNTSILLNFMYRHAHTHTHKS